ncbi:MAG: hypothetical protein AAF548_18145 [Actinomycetota bacterium]
MRRTLVFLSIVSAAAVGAWALPAGQADPAVGTATAVPDAAPELPEEPQVSATETAAVSADPVSVEDTSALAIEPLGVDAATAPPLADAADVVVPAPAQIVTTTTAGAPPVTAPPTTAAPTPAAPAVAFTASQAYGSCEEPIPYDIFRGTATPGSTVTISSPYGNGSTTADGSGHWERTVEFPSAPRGESFTVTVSGVGGSKTFTFTATGGAHH